MNKSFCWHMKDRCAARGFTLLELMIVVAIVAILSAIAYPSYNKYVIRTHRVAAAGCLTQYSNYMERFYTTNQSYSATNAGVAANAPVPVLDCATQSVAYYTYDAIPANLSPTTYTVEAVPIGSQLAADTQCGTLTLSQTGTRTKSGTDTVDKCW
jgi:type IV pilus assembly protein PilE